MRIKYGENGSTFRATPCIIKGNRLQYLDIGSIPQMENWNLTKRIFGTGNPSPTVSIENICRGRVTRPVDMLIIFNLPGRE